MVGRAQRLEVQSDAQCLPFSEDKGQLQGAEVSARSNSCHLHTGAKSLYINHTF